MGPEYFGRVDPRQPHLDSHMLIGPYQGPDSQGVAIDNALNLRRYRARNDFRLKPPGYGQWGAQANQKKNDGAKIRHLSQK